jgi:hypothetical protein
VIFSDYRLFCVKNKIIDGDVGTSRQPTNYTNPSVILVPRETNLNELSYGLAGQKTIPEYTKNPGAATN